MSQTPIFPTPQNPKFTFIDLFAGLGGFRMALQQLGGECVFSSEWDNAAQKTYATNYGEVPYGDITDPEVVNSIPQEFDILCAGFPCQPFSVAGDQKGFADTRGTLFFDLCKIVEKHKPKYLLLENVSNLVSHDGGNTYRVISKSLRDLGYEFPEEPLLVSPNQFGLPVKRPRVFIPCIRKDLINGNFILVSQFKNILEKEYTNEIQSVDTIIDPTIDEKLSDYESNMLEMWDDFYKTFKEKIIGFTVLVKYFKFDGDYDQLKNWLRPVVRKNVNFYNDNKEEVDKWLERHNNLDWVTPFHTKLEWNAGRGYDSLFDCFIQIRPSGVRITKPTMFATLVATDNRQIIGKLKRKLTAEEAKLLQSLPKNYKLVGSDRAKFKQLGNSVNVKVVKEIAKVLLSLI